MHNGLEVGGCEIKSHQIKQVKLGNGLPNPTVKPIKSCKFLKSPILLKIFKLLEGKISEFVVFRLFENLEFFWYFDFGFLTTFYSLISVYFIASDFEADVQLKIEVKHKDHLMFGVLSVENHSWTEFLP